MSKRFFAIMLTALFSALTVNASDKSNEVLRQLIKNLHGGMEVHTTDGTKSYSGYVGTGYKLYFYKDKAYIKPEIDVKWGQFKYDGGHEVETSSVAVPVTVGYHVFNEELLGMEIFGGGRYEYIFNATNNTYSSSVNSSQFGLTAGASIRLLNAVSLNVSYFYGLTSLFSDGTGKTSSFNFSFNF